MVLLFRHKLSISDSLGGLVPKKSIQGAICKTGYIPGGFVRITLLFMMLHGVLVFGAKNADKDQSTQTLSLLFYILII